MRMNNTFSRFYFCLYFCFEFPVHSRVVIFYFTCDFIFQWEVSKGCYRSHYPDAVLNDNFTELDFESDRGNME